MLLIGGGTGIAPLLSILRHVIENGMERDMRLYWGVRSERDLYAHATLENLEPPRRAHALTCRCCRSPRLHGAAASGWVHEAALQDIDDLECVSRCMPPARRR